VRGGVELDDLAVVRGSTLGAEVAAAAARVAAELAVVRHDLATAQARRHVQLAVGTDHDVVHRAAHKLDAPVVIAICKWRQE
jgi:hypothetical protein